MSVRHRTLLAVVACITCACAARARAQPAQKVVIGPVEAEVGGEAVRKSAGDALNEALRMQGLTVVVFEESKKPAVSGPSCDAACAARSLRAVSADLSAIVKITGNAERGPEQAEVRLLDTAGHHFEGSAKLRDGDVRDATTRALLDARSYQLLGPGPWLRVEGTPEGADVLIDGSVVGQLPYRASLAPGKHALVVRDAGYTRFEKPLDVASQDSLKLEIKVALEPAPIEAPSAALDLQAPVASRAHENETSHAWLAAPIAIGVVGIGLAALTTARLASGVDPCIDPDASARCTQKRGVRAWSTAAAYGLSAALIGTGIVWIVLGTQDDPRRQVAANIGIDHIALSGSF